MFREVQAHRDIPSAEAAVRRFWKDRGIFAKSLAQNADKPTYLFYEGPPTANGMPHNGHVLTRAIKDLFPRYKSMRGYHVLRKAGWDTHGLPVEVEVEKSLGIHGKESIEAYGLEAFTKQCIDSVFRYTGEWEELTEKIGFWVDMEDAYVTFHQSYVESVWWALKTLYDRGLLYRGHKVVWWWAQGGTALSAGEVGLGYRDVDDPSITVRFKVVGQANTYLLGWTTTPWTLPSNVGLAVKPSASYATYELLDDEGLVIERVICAEALADAMFGERPRRVAATCTGADLVGMRYEQLLPYVVPESGDPFRVVAADFVELSKGSAVVHMAPAFGEDDYRIARAENLGFLQLVKPDGTFDERVSDFAGMFCKKADPKIIKLLKDRNLLFHEEVMRHPYPFCWRAKNDPLIQYARDSWFIKTTDFQSQAMENNQNVNWYPGHIKDGRFGDFLANNVDWALSRERFWGTPLPIWVNDVSGERRAVGSVAELLELNPEAFAAFEAAREENPTLSPHLKVHKPWIDEVTFSVPGEEGVYRRVTEVIDCWFDSGCMPFAQWGYPHQNRERFEQSFPADFISEAIDQTRGWFYSLIMISSLLFSETDEEDQRPGMRPTGFPHPFRNCIVLGHVCDTHGKKESKSSGNYTPPDLILDGSMKLLVVEGKEPPAGKAHVSNALYQCLDLGKQSTVELCAGDASQTRGLLAKHKVKDTKKALSEIVLNAEDRAALGVEIGGSIQLKVAGPGADAFRWFFYATNPPWNNTRHSLRNVREGLREFLIKLYNVYSFFNIYARIDGFDPAAGNGGATGCSAADLAGSERYPSERSELDRWMLCELHLTIREMTERLDAYDLYEAARRLQSLVESLSNWYVRRSRKRFWSGGAGDAEADKQAAYWTLYECLVTICRLAAPFVPFLSEEMYQNLVVGPWPDSQPESVHLTAWPQPDASLIDEELAWQMGAVREIVRLGLAARASQKIKVRQPLREVLVILADPEKTPRGLAHLVEDELNIKQLRFAEQADTYVSYEVKLNFKAVGRKFRALVPALKKALQSADAAELKAQLDARGSCQVPLPDQSLELTRDEVEIAVKARPGYIAATSALGVVVLDTELDDALICEGRAREIVNRVQTQRKKLGLEYTDRITLGFVGSATLQDVVRSHSEYLQRETLCNGLHFSELADATFREVSIDGEELGIYLARSES